MTDLTATLAERGARYGKFEDHAVIAQGLKDQMWATEGWSRLAPDQRQALEVIQDKVARSLNGDPDYTDNWHDIAGYSRLVEDRLNERATAMAKWNEPVSGFVPSNAQVIGEKSQACRQPILGIHRAGFRHHCIQAIGIAVLIAFVLTST